MDTQHSDLPAVLPALTARLPVGAPLAAESSEEARDNTQATDELLRTVCEPTPGEILDSSAAPSFLLRRQPILQASTPFPWLTAEYATLFTLHDSPLSLLLDTHWIATQLRTIRCGVRRCCVCVFACFFM
jgi:hypothetical protein